MDSGSKVWIQLQLADILSINSGRDYKHLNQGDIPVYGTGGYMTSVDEQLSGENAIGLGRKGTINKPQLLSPPFWTVDTLFYLIPFEKYDLTFIYYLFQTINWLKYDESTGVPSLSKKTIEKIKVLLPSLEEQIAIGNKLKEIDTIITLEQEKFKQFKLVYHALIQKLLISDSSTGPEIRIENHHQNWVLQKVSDIFKITRGNVLAKSKVMSRKDDENIYPVFSSQTMDNGLMGYFNKYLFENAITWTTDGANAGTVTYRRDKFYSTNVNGVLLSEEGYASEVVALILNNTAYKYVSYVGNPKLMNNVMADIKIYLPTDMVELDKLNLLFVQSKNILHKMEQSTLRYKNIKKILLRNLFV